MEDLVKAVVKSFRYESYNRIKEQLDFTVVFASLRTVWHHSCEHMAFAIQIVQSLNNSVKLMWQSII